MVIRLSVGIIGILSLVAAKPLPQKYPQDLIRDGCVIHSDSNGRYPLTLWMDLLDIPPDPNCNTEPKHSWCSNNYSMWDSVEKAQKDCARFLKDVRKELKKVGR